MSKKLIKKVKTILPNNRTAGEREVGSFLRLKGENFFRRVNSDGTLTKVEDGKNGTMDFRGTPKRVQEQTSWRLALGNGIDPTEDYPEGLIDGVLKYITIKKKQKQYPDTQDYRIHDTGQAVSDAAWRKYLGLEYDENILPQGVFDDRSTYGNNTVRLPKDLELEIPVDTNLIKNRISANERYVENHPYSVPASVKVALAVDNETLAALRKTYTTGEPVGVNEMSYNSRNWGVDGQMTLSPLNVLKEYNIRYDPEENAMYYSDEYNFDNSDSKLLRLVLFNQVLDGKPFRFRGKIDLNKK